METLGSGCRGLLFPSGGRSSQTQSGAIGLSAGMGAGRWPGSSLAVLGEGSLQGNSSESGNRARSPENVGTGRASC